MFLCIPRYIQPRYYLTSKAGRQDLNGWTVDLYANVVRCSSCNKPNPPKVRALLEKGQSNDRQ